MSQVGVMSLALRSGDVYTRVVHNPAILIPLVEKKNGNPATFAVIHAIFENSGKNSGISKSRYFYGPLIPLIHSRCWISLVITYKTSPLKIKENNMRKLEILVTGTLT